jgi:hypothetical protein
MGIPDSHLGRRLALIAVLANLGADGCPLSPSSDTVENSGGLDVGGPSGAMWQMTFDPRLLLTLRQGERATSAQTDERRSPLVVDGQTIDLSSFCWRADVVCPQQVFPEQTIVLQPRPADPSQVVMGFNRRGPLAAFGQAVGLSGRLEGRELTAALHTEQPGDPCALQSGSALIATVFVDADDEPASDGTDAPGNGARANEIGGRVTLIYSGACLAIGGSAAIDPGARVELGAELVARRR